MHEYGAPKEEMQQAFKRLIKCIRFAFLFIQRIHSTARMGIQQLASSCRLQDLTEDYIANVVIPWRFMRELDLPQFLSEFSSESSH
jgi:hypothetical protein